MPDQVLFGKGSINLENTGNRAVGCEILEQVEVARVHANDQAVRLKVVEQHPHQSATVASATVAHAFAQRLLDPAKGGQMRVLFFKDIFDGGDIGALADTFEDAFGDVPFLTHHNQKFPFMAKCAFRLPEPRRKTVANVAPSRQERPSLLIWN